jgi:hypothetical protein
MVAFIFADAMDFNIAAMDAALAGFGIPGGINGGIKESAVLAAAI